MTKGGFHPQSRLEQDLVEIQVGAGVYLHLDEREDQLVENLLSWLRQLLGHVDHVVAQLERWEQAWRAADRNADQSVTELGDLALQATGYLTAPS